MKIMLATLGMIPKKQKCVKKNKQQRCSTQRTQPLLFFLCTERFHQGGGNYILAIKPHSTTKPFSFHWKVEDKDTSNMTESCGMSSICLCCVFSWHFNRGVDFFKPTVASKVFLLLLKEASPRC